MKLKTFVNVQDKLSSLNILNDPDAVKVICESKVKPEMEVDQYLRKEVSKLDIPQDADQFKQSKPLNKKLVLVSSNSPYRQASLSHWNVRELEGLNQTDTYKQ